jgi:glycosyltransferase involved in cell wall biosynthesis
LVERATLADLAGLDFVLLYAPPWSGPTRFSKHHLARHLAMRGSTVLYVEAPLTPMGLRRGRTFLGDLLVTLRAAREVAPRLWVRRHFLPVPYHAASRLTDRRAANRIGQRLLAPVIRRDLARLGLRNPVLIAGLPHAFDLLPRLPRRGVVYHCADDYAGVRGFPRSLPGLEADLCRAADLVIATSSTLCEERRTFNSNTHWVPNGADIAHFSQPAAPNADLLRLAHPVAGFIGGLSQWLDMDLVARVADLRPRVTFVLIGPIGTDISVVQTRPNVVLLGPRPYAALPSYLAGMDVALIPFRQDRVTSHADPIKAYEYLAAGLPVVATDLPALRRFERFVRLADSAESFAAQLDAALAESADPHRRAERLAEAAGHSWAQRFAVVDALIAQTFLCAS